MSMQLTMLTRCMQKVKTGIQYIIAQCVGGVLGAYAAFNLLPGKSAFHATFDIWFKPKGS